MGQEEGWRIKRERLENTSQRFKVKYSCCNTVKLHVKNSFWPTNDFAK